MTIGLLLEEIRLWIEQVILTFGYVGIGLAMFVENLFPPIPSEVVLLFSGSLASQGSLSVVGILIASTLGSLGGALVIYAVGVWSDERLIRRFVARYGQYLLLDEQELDRALLGFDRYGPTFVLTARIVPVIRSLISLPAGMSRMDMRRFLLFTTLGTSVWNAFLCGLGFVLGNNWGRMLSFFDHYEHFVLGLSVALAVAFIIWKVRQRRLRAARSAASL